MKRSLDMIILSGIRLGNPTSQVEALQQYLNNVAPKAIILNGNFIKDTCCQEDQIAIIRTLTNMAEEGIRIYYIADNAPLALQAHPEFFHRNVYFENHLTLRLKGKKYLFLNNHFIQEQFGSTNVPVSGELFAEKALAKAQQESCDYIICGHNCQPKIKVVETENQRITYMHPGDWQQHLSALEYTWGCWSLYQYEEEQYSTVSAHSDVIWGASEVGVLEKVSVSPCY